MKTATLMFLLMATAAQNQSQHDSPKIQKAIDAASKACPRSTMDIVNAWSEQISEDQTATIKLSWQELEDRIQSANACITLIMASEASRDPRGKQEDSSSRILAYQVNAGRVVESCLNRAENSSTFLRGGKRIEGCTTHEFEHQIGAKIHSSHRMPLTQTKTP